MNPHAKAPDGGELISPGKIRLAKIASLLIGVPALAITYYLLFFRSSTDSGQPDLGDQASYSYLFSVLFFLTLGFGGLFWTILHHATNSGWGIVVRRQMENLAGILPWMFLLMVPFWTPQVRQDLWEWESEAREMRKVTNEHLPAALKEETAAWEAARKPAEERLTQVRSVLAEASKGGKATTGELAALRERERDLAERLSNLDRSKPGEATVKLRLMREQDPLLASKLQSYFDGGYGAAYVRLGAYTVVFILIVSLLRSWSIRTDRTRDSGLFLRSRYWSCFFIFPFALGYTFLVVDLVMALNYKWYSTMWGVYLFAGAAFSSMAVLILIVTWLRSLGYLKMVTDEHYHLMGKLLFAFCVFWAYIAFSQYFLIWYSNITEETQFYLLRNSGWWNVVSMALVVGHFFIPFVILLWRPVKKTPALLSLICLWALFMHLLDIYWMIIPERAPSLTAAGGTPVLWTPGVFGVDLLSFAGVAGVVAFIFLQVLGRSSLYPCGDPRLEESVHVVN